MLGRRGAEQYEFFAGSLRDLIPDEHVLARVHRVLDLSWLRSEVSDLYCPDNGRPGIDPEAALRLMLAGFLLGVVHDRRLMREASVNLAIRWFAGFGLTDRLPDHSSLTRIRQRWGEVRFRRIFERTVTVCIAAKVAKGEVVHVDASLIRADVSWEALAKRWVEKVGEENPAGDVAERDAKQSGKYKKICTTDPDATMTTTGRNQRLEPSYKQHTSVDDDAGVVLDVHVTTGEDNEGGELVPALDRIEALTGTPVAIATADAGYAYAKVYGRLEARGIDAVIPPKAEPIRSPVPMRRFKYDARDDALKCPRGKILKAGRAVKHGRFFTSRAKDCRNCDLARLCLSGGRTNKAVVVGHYYPALLRARRRREKWTDRDRELYRRHRWKVEGVHGEAKSCHGMDRAVRRGLWNMRIQAYLAAAAINLKRLAAALIALLYALIHARRPGGWRSAPITHARHLSCSAAGGASFLNSPRVHWMRNAQSYVPKGQQSMVSAALRQAFIQPDRANASQTLRHVADQVRAKWPKLAAFIDESETDVLAHMDFPSQHRSKIHSTNPLERLNKEVKRRADVVGIFPNEGAIIRLIGAVLLEANDEWQLQHRYMQTEAMAELTPPLIDAAPTQIATIAA